MLKLEETLKLLIAAFVLKIDSKISVTNKFAYRDLQMF